MTNKIECEKLLQIIKEDYPESLPYFYRHLYEHLLHYVNLFENCRDEEDEEDEE